jgi:hypothetical protein
LQRSKPYYVFPAWPVLFAAGAVALERATTSRPAFRAVAALVLVSGQSPLIPLVLPVLPVEVLVGYMQRLGIVPPQEERHALGVLPQHFADMHGWQELARDVSAVYVGLPAAEREGARVFCGNYGEAGALEYYATRYALPPAISGHNNYWFWGPGPDGGTLLVIGGKRAELEPTFESVVEAGRTSCTYCMPYENDQSIWICRGWKRPLHELWPAVKHFQ